MEFARRIETTDGAELSYWIWRPGEQPATPVLLIHGAASNHSRWSEFARKSVLRERHDLIRPDMRGNAQSMARGRLGLEVWCRDLIEILDAEGYDQVIVVGHSLGAQIALRLAVHHTKRLRALVLIDPVVRSALQGKRLWTKRMEPLFWIAIGLLWVLNSLGLRRRVFPLMDLEALDRETRKAMRGEHPREELVQRYSALGLILRHMPTANYLQQLIATGAPLPALEKILAPTLILESAGVDFMNREISRAELGRLPHHEIVTIDATHWPLTERPDEVRSAIETFIDHL